MYEHIQSEKYNDYCFYAALQGVDLSKNIKNTKQSHHVEANRQQGQQELPLFQDPKSYDHLSQEEKDKLTKEMKRKHKKWAQGKKTVGAQ